MNEFEIKNGVLIRYHGDGGDVIIPEGVTAIGDNVFTKCTRLTGITLPNGVISIGSHAFQDCKHLLRIHLPEGLTSIGRTAFDGCTALTEIKIPEGITEIEFSTFRDCTGLISVILPDSVEEIGWFAFQRCISLKSIVIPKGVRKIGWLAFEGCTDLTSITIPDGLEMIAERAFEDCIHLKGITIPDSVGEIGEHAFCHCEALTLRYLHYIFPAVIAKEINTAVLHMVKTKDFSADIAVSVKAYVIFGMYLSNPDEEILFYIRKNFLKMFKVLIDMQDTDTARQIIEAGKFINKENIDELIQYAIEKKAYEIQVMLTDDKAQNIGYDDIHTTIRKKFAL